MVTISTQHSYERTHKATKIKSFLKYFKTVNLNVKDLALIHYEVKLHKRLKMVILIILSVRGRNMIVVLWKNKVRSMSKVIDLVK